MAESVPSYKIVAGTVARASAALPAAGAYDTAGTATAVSVLDRDFVSIWCTYTRGAADGRAKVKVIASADDGTTYATVLVTDGTTPSAAMPSYSDERNLPVSTGATAEEWMLPPLDVSCFTHIKVLGAESGVTGTPGALVITLASRRAVR